MSTKLHTNIIFGPVKSRRLGTSLGINLTPEKRKICSFNCIYCECGFNETSDNSQSKFSARKEVKGQLEEKFKKLIESGEFLDSITFSGNGEPTMHPDFAGVIDDVIELRDKYYPQAKISVLSNSTRITHEDIFNALNKVDNNILKLDAGTDELVRKIDQPISKSFNLVDLVKQLKRFNGNLIIQTMFLRGTYLGESVDNTTEENISQWVKIIEEIKPKQVMIYSLDRDTPAKTIEKVEKKKLEEIGKKISALGIPVQIA